MPSGACLSVALGVLACLLDLMHSHYLLLQVPPPPLVYTPPAAAGSPCALTLAYETWAATAHFSLPAPVSLFSWPRRQWHRDPFSEANQQLSYLHRGGEEAEEVAEGAAAGADGMTQAAASGEGEGRGAISHPLPRASAS